ncbi:MAG: hypothetical protein QOC70_508 [Verrucomicrobiota bacterium]|jgi:hypothetical protein
MIGNCFFFATPPNGEHLFVVLAPSGNPDAYVCVNITERDASSDTTCEVAQAEHAVLTKPVSIVAYAWARELPLRLIERLVKAQNLPTVSEALLLRIQRGGLSRTSRLKKGFQAAIAAHLESARSAPEAL